MPLRFTWDARKAEANLRVVAHVERGNVIRRAEYDFSGGVRGKYASRFPEGTTLVLLAPDVAAAFPTADEVNRALRTVMQARTKPRTA